MAADPRDLCSLADVKAATEAATATGSRDGIIETLITDASVAIMGRLERELAPQTNAASRVVRVNAQERAVDGTLVVDLAPWDLRAATSIHLHPETSSPIALTANHDYSLEPFGAPQGSYQRLRLSRYVVITSQFEVSFGYAQLQITGNWGLWDTDTVDSDVRGACVLTVRSWLRQAITSEFAPQNEPGVQPGLPATYDIPAVALRRIKRYARMSA